MSIGYSVYISHFEQQKPMFETIDGKDKFVFTSLHMKEEMSDPEAYRQKAFEILQFLKEKGFFIIGDVSPITLEVFNASSLEHFIELTNIDCLRLDYGFSNEELLSLAERYPVCFNASTVKPDVVRKLKELNTPVYACHNFYPRPETGLDDEQFCEINEDLFDLDIHTMAFIPGKDKRKPIFEGLPTLERHRNLPAYVAFLDLIIKEKINTVLVGDLTIDELDQEWIDHYLTYQEITIPVTFRSEYHHLYNKVFTIRSDSPLSLLRLTESRLMKWDKRLLLPSTQFERPIGTITVDNTGFGRYQGEIQILRVDRPKDPRINVIGQVDPNYLALLPIIPNRAKIRLVSRK